MNPENYVSIGLAWTLKGLGFPQTCDVCFDMFDVLTANKINERSAFDADAPTVSELFAGLPIPSGGRDVPFLYTGICRTFGNGGADKYFCKVNRWKHFTADTMPDAVGKAIVALVKAKKLRLGFLSVEVDVSEFNKVLDKKAKAKADLQFMQAAANVGFPI